MIFQIHLFSPIFKRVKSLYTERVRSLENRTSDTCLLLGLIFYLKANEKISDSCQDYFPISRDGLRFNLLIIK